MTKEQRKRLQDHHVSEALEWDECADERSLPSWKEDARTMAAMHRAALALLTDEAEADRKLGAAVRSWCFGFDPASGSHADCVFALAEDADSVAVHSEAAMMLRAIASALREEKPR